MMDSETVSFPLIKLNAIIKAIYGFSTESKKPKNESDLTLIMIKSDNQSIGSKNDLRSFSFTNFKLTLLNDSISLTGNINS